MFAKVYFDGVTNGALDLKDIFNDMIKLITGTATDFSGLTVGEVSDNGEINANEAPGWSLESMDDTSEPGYVTWIISGLCSGSATRKKYVLFRYVVADGDVHWQYADAVSPSNPTTRLYNTLNDYELTTAHSGWTANSFIPPANVGYYMFLCCNENYIFMIPGYSTRNAFFLVERERAAHLPYDTPDSDFCPLIAYGGNGTSTANSSANYNPPVPDPFSDIPNAYLLRSDANASGFTGNRYTLIRVGDFSWFTEDGTVGNARKTRNDGSNPLTAIRPKFVTGLVELGLLHSNVKVRRYHSDGAPTNIIGQKFTEQTEGEPDVNYICLAMQWGTTTTVGLYFIID